MSKSKLREWQERMTRARQEVAADEMRMEPVLRPTRIPTYKSDCYPIILQKNVSVFGQLLGDSDVDKIEDSYTHKPKQAFGFRTDNKTRPAAIAALVTEVRERSGQLHDRATLEEMLTFVRNEAGRPEAENGAYDDCIMALAIAHYIRPQQRTTRETPEAERVVWTADMWDDWRHASPDERAYLESKWGKPRRR